MDLEDRCEATPSLCFLKEIRELGFAERLAVEKRHSASAALYSVTQWKDGVRSG